jgi:hypothetical protein
MAAPCLGLGFIADGDQQQQQNPYEDKNLFDGKNYQAILDRFNNGKLFSSSNFI